MDPVEKAKVKNNATIIVETLEPWDVVDLLYQERILSDEEYSRIGTLSVREDRCRKILNILCRGSRLPGKPSPYPVFLRALADEYSSLAEQIDQTEVTEEQIIDTMSAEEMAAPQTQSINYNFHGQQPVQIGNHNKMDVHQHGNQVKARQKDIKPVTVTDTGAAQTRSPSMRKWTCEQVYLWLCENGVQEEHASMLRQQQVTGDVFEVTTSEELKTDFPNLPVGPRKLIIRKRDCYLKECSTVNNKEETGTQATSRGYDEVDQCSAHNTHTASNDIGLSAKASVNRNIDQDCVPGTSFAQDTASQKSTNGNPIPKIAPYFSSSMYQNREGNNQNQADPALVHSLPPIEVPPTKTKSWTNCILL